MTRDIRLADGPAVGQVVKNIPLHALKIATAEYTPIGLFTHYYDMDGHYLSSEKAPCQECGERGEHEEDCETGATLKHNWPDYFDPSYETGTRIKPDTLGICEPPGSLDVDDPSWSFRHSYPHVYSPDDCHNWEAVNTDAKKP